MILHDSNKEKTDWCWIWCKLSETDKKKVEISTIRIYKETTKWEKVGNVLVSTIRNCLFDENQLIAKLRKSILIVDEHKREHWSMPCEEIIWTEKVTEEEKNVFITSIELYTFIWGKQMRSMILGELLAAVALNLLMILFSRPLCYAVERIKHKLNHLLFNGIQLNIIDTREQKNRRVLFLSLLFCVLFVYVL